MFVFGIVIYSMSWRPDAHILPHTMEAPDFAPPPLHPPPLLTDKQLFLLAQHGHLQFQLSPSLYVLYEQLSAASASFFRQPTHRKIQEYPAADRSGTGYTNIEDEKEYITFHHATRPDPHLLEQLTGQVWQQTSTLLYRVLADLARAMGLAYEPWDSVLDGCLSMPPSSDESTPTQLRTFNYSPNSGIAEAHTDLGLLTLCVGFGKGLQVHNQGSRFPKAAQWIDVEGPTLLVGQVLRTMTGNRVRAGLHRVVGNPAGRQSIVFALRPSLRHDHTDLALFGGEGTLNMSELWAKIRSSRYSVNAQKKVRAEQKEHMRPKKGRWKSIWRRHDR